VKGAVRYFLPQALLTSERSGDQQKQTARLREAGVGWGLLRGGISKSLLFAGIGVEGGVNLPRGIRVGITYQTPSETYDFSRR